MSTGMGLEQVRSEFDIPRLEAFGRYTAQWPPIHILLAGFMGLGQAPAKPDKSQEEALADLISQLPQS